MFDKRFGFKSKGGKVPRGSLIDLRTYSLEKVLLMKIEKCHCFRVPVVKVFFLFRYCFISNWCEI